MAPSEITFGASLAFLGGVALGSAGAGGGTMIPISLFGGFLLGRILQAAEKQWRFVLLFACTVLAGSFYYHAYVNFREAREKLVYRTEATITMRVTSEARRSVKTQQFSGTSAEPFQGTISVIASRFPEVRYGDLVELGGVIVPRETPHALPEMRFPEFRITSRDGGFRLLAGIFDLKERLIAQFRRFLPADAAALAAGLTFGVRSDFSPALKEAMTQSGTTHLVALSGYNISLVGLAVAGIFLPWIGRRKTFYLTTAFITLFVLMVGAQASVVRAAVMGMLLLLAQESGRQYDMRNAIVFAATAMTVFDPTILVFDFGFALSFISLLGVVYVAPAIRAQLGGADAPPGLLGWRNNLATTLGAQLAVAPLLIRTFGGFSLSAIPANVLALEAVPIAMLLGFLLAALAAMLPALGTVLAAPLAVVLAYIIWVIKFFASIQIPVGGIYASAAVMLGYYALLAAFAAMRRKTP